MTATRLSYSTLASAPYDNLFSVIDTRANITDPIDPSGNRKFVYTREPDVTKAGFQGFPYIIVHGMDFTPSRETVDMRSAQQDFNGDIEIVTCDRGRGSSDGQGFSQLQSITNDVLKTMNDATIRKSLRLYGMLFSMPKAQKSVVEPFTNTLVYRRVIAQSFKTRMKVSA